MDGTPPPSYDEVSGTKPPYPTDTTTYPTPNPGGAVYPPTNAAPSSGSSFYPAQNRGRAVYPAAPMAQATFQTGTGGSTVVVTQPPTMFIHTNPYGFIPANVKCPHCHQQTVTVLDYRSGGATWVVCGLTCLVGLFCGCCLIPFCIDGLKDVVHICSHCHQEIGYRKRLS